MSGTFQTKPADRDKPQILWHIPAHMACQSTVTWTTRMCSHGDCMGTRSTATAEHCGKSRATSSILRSSGSERSRGDKARDIPTSAPTAEVHACFGFTGYVIGQYVLQRWRILSHYFHKHYMLHVCEKMRDSSTASRGDRTKTFKLLVICRQAVDFRVVVQAPAIFVSVRCNA